MNEKDQAVFNRSMQLMRTLNEDLSSEFEEYRKTWRGSEEYLGVMSQLTEDLRAEIREATRGNREWAALSSVNETSLSLLRILRRLEEYFRRADMVSKLALSMASLAGKVASIEAKYQSPDDQRRDDQDSILAYLNEQEMATVAGWLAAKGVAMG